MNKRELKQACQELRHDVENEAARPSIVAVNGVYRGRDKEQVATITDGPWTIGYRVREILPSKPGFFLREVFIKNSEQTLEEIPDREKDEIGMTAVSVLLEQNMGMPVISSPSPNTVLFQQEFQPMLLTRPKMVRL